MNTHRKVKTVSQLKSFRNNSNNIWVMAHGCFDLVHPGHLRHLGYAKNKGDVLVVSITSDEFVQKGEDRPYINQELRAQNLAALEIVDFVVINNGLTPIDLIKKIKPDIFVKGVEYQGNRQDSEHLTNEEQQALDLHGGQLVFTPGDIVFSSTTILDDQKPNLDIERLRALFDAQGISKKHIKQAYNRSKNRKVTLIGDTIIDRYTYCATLGKTTKTPTLSFKYDYSEDFIGGAAIVARHIAAMGGKVKFITLVGDDSGKDFLLSELENDNNIEILPIIDKTRPTTIKERFWAENYKMFQVDRVDNSPINEKEWKTLTGLYSDLCKDSNVSVFSDFRHGIFNKKNASKLVNTGNNNNNYTIADTQVSARWGNITDFRKADLLCPNEKEARFAIGDQDLGVLQLGRYLLKDTKAKNLILKLSERGLIAFEKFDGLNKNPDKVRDYYPLSSLGDDVVDAVGSGDALLAAAALCIDKSTHILTVAFIANCAAAIALGRMGNQTIDYEEMSDFLNKKLNSIFL